VNDGRKKVAEGFAGTGLGDGNKVASGQGDGPTLRLNGGRGRIVLSLDFFHHVIRHSSLLEAGDRVGHVLALDDGDLFLEPVLLDGARVSVDDVRVWVVEMFLKWYQRELQSTLSFFSLSQLFPTK